jgi:D-glycero-D-manno-heptose 1,7-bisphosphate phosphatase
MIEHARADFAIDLSQSFVAGDQASDLGLARSVGIPGILVLTGFGRWQSQHLPTENSPDFIAENLLSAVQWLGRRIGRI